MLTLKSRRKMNLIFNMNVAVLLSLCFSRKGILKLASKNTLPSSPWSSLPPLHPPSYTEVMRIRTKVPLISGFKINMVSLLHINCQEQDQIEISR